MRSEEIPIPINMLESMLDPLISSVPYDGPLPCRPMRRHVAFVRIPRNAPAETQREISLAYLSLMGRGDIDCFSVDASGTISEGLDFEQHSETGPLSDKIREIVADAGYLLVPAEEKTLSNDELAEIAERAQYESMFFLNSRPVER